MNRQVTRNSISVGRARAAAQLTLIAASLLVVGAGCSDTTEGPDSEAQGSAESLTATQLTVTLRTGTGNYLVADQGGGAALMAYSTWAKEWETFTLKDLNGGELVSGDVVTLKGMSGQWVSADGGGGGALTVTAPWEKDWEQFHIVKVGGSGTIVSGDKIALQTKLKVNYVSAINGGGGEVHADAPWAKGWETFTIGIGGQGQTPPSGSTPREKVLNYFNTISGHKTIAGQHNKFSYSAAESTNAVQSITGRKAGLWSADFGFGQELVNGRAAMIAEAKNQWNSGAVVQLMYHACAPTGDEYCSWDDIGVPGSNKTLSDAQWSQLVTNGTSLNNAWKARLDTLSVFFADLKAAGVAPLFRPLHEMNQGIFWWGGRGGANGTRKLWQITHDYLTNTKGFDNIIWVWDVQDFDNFSSDVSAYNPGASYFDIAALDVYGPGYGQDYYDLMVGASSGKPIAIGECEHLPTSAHLASHPKWAFFMLWPDFIDEDTSVLPSLYGASNVITLDEMPGWK